MAEIDTLQVKITANAQSAAASLKSLSNALAKVKSTLSGFKGMSHAFDDVNHAIKGISTSDISKLNDLTSALNQYAEAANKVAGVRGGKRVNKKIAEALKIRDEAAISSGGSDTSDSADKIADKGEKVKTVWEKIGEAFGKAGTALKGFIHRHTQLLRTFGRIALYRLIRSAIKAISEAFSEGLKNAYGFSKQSESFTRLAETLDRIKSITSQMINQLGAWWGEVKQLVLPAIEWIVDKIRFAAEYLTELFAALNGAPTYLRAKYEAKAWDEATGKAKEYKHQLLGIDELNNLSSQKAGGSKADDTDYNKLYEEVKVSEKLISAANGIKEFAFKVSDVLFDWTDLTAYDIEDKLIVGLSALTGGLIGGVPGAIVGTLAGIGLTMLIDKLNPSRAGREKYTDLDFYDILIPALGALAGGVLGSKFGLKGSMIGLSLGALVGFTMNGLFNSKKGKDAEKYEGQALLDILYPGLFGLVGAIIGSQYMGVKGALVGLSIGATVGFIMKGMTPSDYDTIGNGEDIVKLLQLGLLGITGFWIGFKYYGMEGALVGASIGVAVGFLLRLFDRDGSGNMIGALDIIEGVAGVLGSLTGAYIGFKIGGVKGGLIGLVIGVSLSFVIEKFGKMENVAKSDFASNLMKTVAGAVGADDVVEQIDLTRNSNANEGQPLVGSVLRPDNGKSGATKAAFLSDDWFAEQFEEIFDNRVLKLTGGHRTVSGKFATGGIPQSGSLFYAGENGNPEWVGNIGGNTAVANTGQMTDAIFKAAYMGMSKALKENGGGMNGYEPATMDDLFIAMKKKASNYNKRTGNPAFA